MNSRSQLLSGVMLDLAHPDPDVIGISDIATGLGNLCRYAGQVKRHYSVAEHSCLIAEYLFEETGDPLLALAGLLHDSHEGTVGDPPWPFLCALSDQARSEIRTVGHRVRDAIVLCVVTTLRLPALPECDHAMVGFADIRILLDERDELLARPREPWEVDTAGYAPLGVNVVGQPASFATRRWTNDLVLYASRARKWGPR